MGGGKGARGLGGKDDRKQPSVREREGKGERAGKEGRRAERGGGCGEGWKGVQ